MVWQQHRATAAFWNAILKTLGYEAYHIDIIYCRSQPDSTSSYRGTADSCTSLSHYANVTVTQTQRRSTACACDSKLSLSLRNLLAHLMRPRQNVGTKSDFSSLSYSVPGVCSRRRHAGCRKQNLCLCVALHCSCADEGVHCFSQRVWVSVWIKRGSALSSRFVLLIICDPVLKLWRTTAKTLSWWMKGTVCPLK